MLSYATVSEVDVSKSLAKVKIREFESNFLPYFQRVSKTSRESDPFEVGQQVLVLNAKNQSFILGGFGQNDYPVNASSDSHLMRWYDDRNYIKFDKTGKKLTLKLDEIEFDCKVVKFKINSSFQVVKKGKELLKSIAKGFKTISKSKTNTLAGPQDLIPSAMELPLIEKEIEKIRG